VTPFTSFHWDRRWYVLGAGLMSRGWFGGCSHPKKFGESGLKFPGCPASLEFRPKRRPIGRGRAKQRHQPSAQRIECQAFRCRLLLENGRDGRKSECGQRFRFRDLDRCLSIQETSAHSNGAGRASLLTLGSAGERRRAPSGGRMQQNWAAASQRWPGSTYAGPSRDHLGVSHFGGELRSD